MKRIFKYSKGSVDHDVASHPVLHIFVPLWQFLSRKNCDRSCQIKLSIFYKGLWINKVFKFTTSKEVLWPFQELTHGLFYGCESNTLKALSDSDYAGD